MIDRWMTMQEVKKDTILNKEEPVGSEISCLGLEEKFHLSSTKEKKKFFSKWKFKNELLK